VSVLEAPLLEGLREALGGTEPPHILHYIGHGGLTHGDGNLIFQDADRRSRWVDAVELAQLLPSSTRLLCLSTPFTAQNYQVLGLSHLARALGLVTLPTTITNQYPVREASVRAFWGAFYNELAEQDGNVNEAMHEAQRSAAEADLNIADWASFSLVVRDQTGVSFDLRRSSVDPHRRRGTELAAQFSAQLANDLASQVQILGEDTPKVLREQYEAERVRTDNLLSELEEA
jgi:hypothetical protein